MSQLVAGSNPFFAGARSKFLFTATGGGNPPVNVVPPALDNLSPNVGDTITCSQGTWTGATSYAYQWVQYPNTFILGQTTNQYVVQAGDVGFKFFCQVQAINAVGNTIVDSDITNLVAGGDPLAGITFALRLQASKGFGSTPNAPFSLYQDVFGASPATADGDPVALWRDELGTSGLSAVQSNPLLQPTLRIVNGVPVVQGDGVGTLMSIANWNYSGANTCYVGFCATGLSNAYTSLFNSYQDPSGTDAGAGLLIKSNGKTAVYVVGNSGQSSYDGSGAATISADGAFHVFTAQWQTNAIDSWMDGSVDGSAFTSNTIKTTTSTRIAEILGSAIFSGRSLAGNTTSVLFALSAHDAPTRATINTYLATLNPPP